MSNSEPGILPDCCAVSARSISKETTITLVGTWLISSSQQCFHTHDTLCPEFSMRNKFHCFYSYPTALISFQHSFFLFPKLKVGLKCQPETGEEIQKKSARTANPYFMKIVYGMPGRMETSCYSCCVNIEGAVSNGMMFNTVYVLYIALY
jgi:hypothetical protein